MNACKFAMQNIISEIPSAQKAAIFLADFSFP